MLAPKFIKIIAKDGGWELIPWHAVLRLTQGKGVVAITTWSSNPSSVTVNYVFKGKSGKTLSAISTEISTEEHLQNAVEVYEDDLVRPRS